MTTVSYTYKLECIIRELQENHEKSFQGLTKIIDEQQQKLEKIEVWVFQFIFSDPPDMISEEAKIELKELLERK